VKKVYKQSRRRSAVEAIMNVIIVYMVAVFANLTVLPAFGYNVTLSDGAVIGLAFTIISLIRSYVIRRVFNYYD
jgi:hypothetical protein